MTDKNFFDFMLDAQKDWNLLKKFLGAKDRASLSAVLKDYNVSKDDIEKLVQVKEGAGGISITGGPAQY